MLKILSELQTGRRIVYIVTVPETAHAFLREDFRALHAHGSCVHLITSPGSQLAALSVTLASRPTRSA